MAAKYCVCGAKTEYTAKVPAFCSACGQPFGVAFAKAATVAPLTSSPSITSKAPISRPVRRGPSEESVEGDESEQYDETEVLGRAHEIAALFSAADFFSSKPVEDNRYKAGDVLDKTKDIRAGQRTNVITDPSQLPRLPE